MGPEGGGLGEESRLSEHKRPAQCLSNTDADADWGRDRAKTAVLDVEIDETQQPKIHPSAAPSFQQTQ